MTSGPSAGTSQLAALALLLASMGLTGANVPIGKAIAAEIPIYVFILLRFVLATAALSVLVHGEPGRPLVTASTAEALTVFALALLGSVAFTAFLLEGTRRTTAADAGIIMATLPAVATALGLLMRRERPSPRQLAAVALAVAGVATIHGGAGHSAGGSSSVLGNAFVGLAVLCEATFVLLSAGVSRAFGPIRLSLAVSVVSLGLSVPLAAPQVMVFDAGAVPAAVWGLVAWYAATSSVICTVLWYRGAPHVPTWLAGLATSALPVSALAVSALWLGESLGPARLGGAGLVLLAILIAAPPARR